MAVELISSRLSQPIGSGNGSAAIGSGVETRLDPKVRAAPVGGRRIAAAITPAGLVLIAGSLALALPTMLYVARESWSTEEGAHGPIVLMTGLWLLARLWPSARPLFQSPPMGRVFALLAVLLPMLVFARIVQIVEIEGFATYAALLSALYSVIGGQAMRRLWFPLFYLAFMFPPPDTLLTLVTLPMKTLVSNAAVGLLSALGYPIGGVGVTIVIAQYELLVAAACSGLNSIISLSALSLFYIYIRHQADWGYALLLAAVIVPVALLANFIRVLILILLTYHAGDAAAQGFLHDFAGILMFTVALLSIMLIDAIAMPLWARLRGPLHRDRVLAATLTQGDHASATP